MANPRYSDFLISLVFLLNEITLVIGHAIAHQVCQSVMIIRNLAEKVRNVQRVKRVGGTFLAWICRDS